MSKMKHRRESSFGGPKVLVLHEHHGKMYMDASTEEALHRSALRILRGRLMMDVYYEDDEEFRLEAQKVVNRKDGKQAWSLLQDRCKYESEDIQLEEIETSYYNEEVEV